MLGLGLQLESTKKSGGLPTTFALMSAPVHIRPPDFLVLSFLVGMAGSSTTAATQEDTRPIVSHQLQGVRPLVLRPSYSNGLRVG
jgi:hypothetical protein